MRVDILYAGEFYVEVPVITFKPQKPYVKVTSNSLHPDFAGSRNRLAGRGVENQLSTDVESPPPPPPLSTKVLDSVS